MKTGIPMKAGTINSDEVTPEKGLRAESYLTTTERREQEEQVSGLNLIIRECFQTAKNHGWWEEYDRLRNVNPEHFEVMKPYLISSKLALIHSEVTEALEEVRKGGALARRYYTQKVSGTTREVDHLVNKDGSMNKPEGFGAELADAVIRIFDLAAWLDIPLAEVLLEKMRYNEQREYKHGGKAI